MTDRDDENPYAAPGEATTGFYTVDSRRLSYADYWRMARGNPLGFAVAAAAKTLGLRISYEFGIPDLDRLDPIDREALAPRAREAIAPVAEACEGAGMRFGFAYRVASVGAVRDSAAVAYLSGDRRTIGLILYSRAVNAGVVAENTYLALSSELADGRILGTSNGAWMIIPPRYVRDDNPRRTPAETIEAHRRRLAEAIDPVGAVDPGDLETILLTREREAIDHAVSRGVYVPLTEAELTRLENLVEGPARDDYAPNRLARVLLTLQGYATLVMVVLSPFYLIRLFQGRRTPPLILFSVVGVFVLLDLARRGVVALDRRRSRAAEDPG